MEAMSLDVPAPEGSAMNMKDRGAVRWIPWITGAVIVVSAAVWIGASLGGTSSDGRPMIALCGPWSDLTATRASIRQPAELFDMYRRSLDEVAAAAAAQGRTDIVDAANRLWAEPGFEKRERALTAACRI